jgi:DNA-binding transcriptional LysR family regulator
MDLEVRHLRAIYAIAEAGSLRRASAILHVSQPALTAQLQRIERMVGGQLFDRDQAGAAPTPLGEEIVARTRAVLRAFDELRRDIAAEDDTGLRGARLRIVASEGPLLAGVIGRLREQFPEADITSRSHLGDRPVGEMVAAGLADLAVTGDYPGYEIPAPSEVVACPIVTEPTFVMLAAGHPLLDQVTESGELPIASITEPDWVLSPDDDRGCEYLVGSFERRHCRPNLRHRAAGSVLSALVRAGAGIAFAQATSPGRSGVTIQAVTDTPVWYRHVLLWRRNHPIAQHADLLRQAAFDSYTNAISDSPTFQLWLRRRGLAGDPKLLFSLESSGPFSLTHHYGCDPAQGNWLSA